MTTSNGGKARIARTRDASIRLDFGLVAHNGSRRRLTQSVSWWLRLATHNNYFEFVNRTLSITPVPLTLPVTVIGITATDKVYDGKTAAA